MEESLSGANLPGMRKDEPSRGRSLLTKVTGTVAWGGNWMKRMKKSTEMQISQGKPPQQPPNPTTKSRERVELLPDARTTHGGGGKKRRRSTTLTL